MTNIELISKIKAEIERLKNKMDDRHPLAPNQKAEYLFALADILSFLDTIESEKPVPNDLEEAAIKYATHKKKSEEKEMETELPMGAYYLVKDSFIAGAKWDREQMMKDAVEADVNIYRDLAAGKSWAEFVVEMPINNLGDKVLVIVLPKEDSHE